MKKHFILILGFCLFNSFAQERTLDEFENSEGWKIYKADSVDIQISTVKGRTGNALKLDYNFISGAGYGGIQKFFNISLPQNYQFSFYIKAESPSNNLEFKLIDKSGDNVWWSNNRNYDFPKEWKKVVIKKRKIQFAWGPTADPNIIKADRLEFTIASYVGGKGTVYLDDLKFEELPQVNNINTPPQFYSNLKRDPLTIINDRNDNTAYPLGKNEYIEIDLNGMKEIGGLQIDWGKVPESFEILTSTDYKKIEKIASVESNINRKSILYFPELETKYLRIVANDASINDIKILPIEYSSSINHFFINKTKESERGIYPRYLYEESSYWTLVGWDRSEHEALFNEDGMIESDKSNFSIDPFITMNGKTYNWSNSSTKVSLADDYLPLPTVTREADSISLNISPFAYGDKDKSKLNIIYKIENKSAVVKSGSLVLSVLPFQVNPYYQDLNLTGGFAKISSFTKVNPLEFSINNKKVFLLKAPNKTFIYNVNSGNPFNYIEGNSVTSMSDESGFLAGGFLYDYKLNPGQSVEYAVVVPFEDQAKPSVDLSNIKKENNKARAFWKEKLNRFQINLPSSSDKIVNTIKSNLAYILINKDESGLQPGSRSYERSWIRDGALTSSALLKMGIKDEVKEFIDWFTKYQFADGKVPCVVDKRGADPTPENDSHGELIYLIKTYFNYTHDTLFLSSKYENIIAAAKYIKHLTELCSTDYYKNGNDSLKSLYGLLTESISHEGYSAKPMHSYWDDFFAMKGLKDAYEIAVILNKKEDIDWLKNLRDTFKTNLYNSLRLTFKNTNINYIPGCAELGDFDATSTTIALYPCGELPNLPQPYLTNTFDKYYDFFVKRRDPKTEWVNYTPYENRVIGSYILLNQPDRAFELIDYFLNDTRPYNWNQWGEVVWKDYRSPKLIGDMPHTWVGSDFINSCRMLFVYENEADSSLVIGAGLRKEWIDNKKGMSVKDLPTYYGNISYNIHKNRTGYVVNVSLKRKTSRYSIKSFPLVINLKNKSRI